MLRVICVLLLTASLSSAISTIVSTTSPGYSEAMEDAQNTTSKYCVCCSNRRSRSQPDCFLAIDLEKRSGYEGLGNKSS